MNKKPKTVTINSADDVLRILSAAQNDALRTVCRECPQVMTAQEFLSRLFHAAFLDGMTLEEATELMVKTCCKMGEKWLRQTWSACDSPKIPSGKNFPKGSPFEDRVRVVKNRRPKVNLTTWNPGKGLE